ncbi:MAG: D-aminoacyl-tRNA deacylase [Acidobacteriota bacterium]
MRIVLQRVSSAAVRVDDEEVGAIGRGLLLLVAIEPDDDGARVAAAVEKLTRLRVFEDERGHMNLDAGQVGGAFLVVSQFTLAGSLAKGRRPSFDGAAPPAVAEPLVEELSAGLKERGFEVANGRFGATMEVALVNQGPVTFVLDIPAR